MVNASLGGGREPDAGAAAGEQAAGIRACSRVVGGGGGQWRQGQGQGQEGGSGGLAGRSSSRQRVVNQPSASVTELGICSKELRRGESLLLMKETSVLIESGSSPAARDRPQQFIHISCFAPCFSEIEASAKGGAALPGMGRTPGPRGEHKGQGNQELSCVWAQARVWKGGWDLQASQ